MDEARCAARRQAAAAAQSRSAAQWEPAYVLFRKIGDCAAVHWHTSASALALWGPADKS